jgi:sulfotransferase
MDGGKTIHFIAGLPRSGSTLLANLLSQNPRCHASATSGILEVLFGVRNHWDQLAEFKAAPDAHVVEAAKKRVLRAILEAYYADVPRPVSQVLFADILARETLEMGSGIRPPHSASAPR